MTSFLNRRTFVAAGTASVITPVPAWSQDNASRLYRLSRGGSDIGEHQLTVSRDGDAVKATTEINIAVKFLGITAYRYELAYSELYRDGLLQQLEGTANDDGNKGYVKVARRGDLLEVDGSDYSGPIGGTAAPTSYWRQPALKNTPWISTQSGEILPVRTKKVAPSSHHQTGSRVWRATDNGAFTVDIAYDGRGEWLGCTFDAKGELVTYSVSNATGSLASLAV